MFADWSSLKSLIPPVRVVADLLVRNGTIFTSDTSLPFSDSMAIRNGRILKVGSFSTLKVLHFTLLFDSSVFNVIRAVLVLMIFTCMNLEV